ncbi:MAG: hypothetical protein ABEK50_05095 [bacterium]
MKKVGLILFVANFGLVMVFTAFIGTSGRGFRRMDRIPTSDRKQAVQQGDTGSISVPVPRSVVHQAVQQLVQAWNNGNISQRLSDKFYDAHRLRQAMQRDVPRDARLRLMSIRNVMVNDQSVTKEEDGSFKVSNRVTVDAHTQLVFNDPEKGYQRRDGVNELLLKVDFNVRPTPEAPK